jgi:NAD+ kinase
MNLKKPNILIIANFAKEEVKRVFVEIESYFSDRDVKLFSYSYDSEVPEKSIMSCDLAFSLGGDGTLLGCARRLVDYKIPILGINLGDFGFITEISKDEWIAAYEKYSQGKLGISERLMVNVRLLRDGKVVSEKNGLNEAVIGVNRISRLVNLSTHIGSTYIGRYHADGVIVATPTGSTAYSMSAEGPILHPEMEAMILNPICPFTLSNRPLVVPGNEVVKIKVEEVQRTELMLIVDGQEIEVLRPLDEIIIRKHVNKCRIINSDKRNFYEVLCAKLKWSGVPYA